MSVTQITTRDTMLEKQRLGFDAVILEVDGAVLKVSIGSVIECAGSLYVVDTALETPTGTPAADDYLYFDPSVPGFVWASAAGTYDATKGAVYNGDHRRCRYQLYDATRYFLLLSKEELSGNPQRGNLLKYSLYTESAIYGELDVRAERNLNAGPVISETLADGAQTSIYIGTGTALLTIDGDSAGSAVVLAKYNSGTTIVDTVGGASWFNADAGVGFRVYRSGTTIYIRNSTGTSRDVSVAAVATVSASVFP